MTETCQTIEPLGSAYLDGQLDHDERARVDTHLAACPRCSAEVESLRVTRTMLSSMPTRVLPSSVPAAAGRGRGMTPRRVGIGAAASAAVILLGGAFVIGEETPPPGDVPVPMELFVADHLVHSTNSPLMAPVIVEVSR